MYKTDWKEDSQKYDSWRWWIIECACGKVIQWYGPKQEVELLAVFLRSHEQHNVTVTAKE